MLSVAEAREIVISHFSPTNAISIPIEEAVGLVLSKDIVSEIDLPAFNNSSMDGFAVRAPDTEKASQENPVILRVVEDIPAGKWPEQIIQSGVASRIMTGAPLPVGADAVVIVENTNHFNRQTGNADQTTVSIFHPVKTGDNTRVKGADLKADQVIFKEGHQVRPQDVGMLAMLGVPTIHVHRPPHLALVTTGDELIAVGSPDQPGKIRDGNTPALAALARSIRAEVFSMGVVADDRKKIRQKFDLAIKRKVDLIISTAGVSVGDFDYVKEVVTAHGHLDFWQVNMRPGKPLAFGNFQGIPFFGLPGNPVSAFISFEVFIIPALQRLLGLEVTERPRHMVRLLEEIRSDGRESYLRAIVERKEGILTARLTGHQGSGNMLSLVQANALLIVPSGVKSLPAGTDIEAWMLD